MVRRYYNLYYSNMSCQKKVATVDAAVQTVIRVYPHILDQPKYQQYGARISSDKKMQTEISIKPDEKNEQFYSLLRFTPYQDIQENCIRIINLPRQVRLQFNPGVEFDKMAQVARQFSLADDDGVGYICSELIHRLGKRYRPAYVEEGAQTDLNVYPHLLSDEHVATVKNNLSSQT